MDNSSGARAGWAGRIFQGKHSVHASDPFAQLDSVHTAALDDVYTIKVVFQGTCHTDVDMEL